MSKNIFFKKRFFFGAVLVSLFFIQSCHSLPKPPELSDEAKKVQIIPFRPDLDKSRFESLGESECNLQDISAPLQEAKDLCLARFKDEAAKKGANVVMINSYESTATAGNTVVNGENYITKLYMKGYFIKDKQN